MVNGVRVSFKWTSVVEWKSEAGKYIMGLPGSKAHNDGCEMRDSMGYAKRLTAFVAHPQYRTHQNGEDPPQVFWTTRGPRATANKQTRLAEAIRHMCCFYLCERRVWGGSTSGLGASRLRAPGNWSLVALDGVLMV